MGRFETGLVQAVIVVGAFLRAAPCGAQVGAAAPAAANPQSIKVGATVFADYAVRQAPRAQDVDGNTTTFNAFNVGRAYINVTGSVSRVIAFRVTPDIVRETGPGSSVAGSYTFRLKYAYGQFNLDDWLNPGRTGTWVRLGMQQTPWVDFMETVYRYRFQGPIFEDRENFLASSDVGAGFHTNLPGDYGDVQAGIYNGETYSQFEANDQKAFMVRATARPIPGHPVLRGLRLTGFYDADAYVRDGERRRVIAAATFEHPAVHAAFNYFSARDQPRVAAVDARARGFSAWVTPRVGKGWEGVLRYDHLEPDTRLDVRKGRTIAGVSYWFSAQGPATAALLLDVETIRYRRYLPARPTERRVALHMLVNF